MLHEFLDQHKKEIIQLCREKVLADSALKPTSALLDRGLPLFYDELMGVLQRTATATNSEVHNKNFISENKIKIGDAGDHGKESLRLGYTISQVVHSYGAVCQSITEFVQNKSCKITPREFQDLNFALDCAIAEAVTEFEKMKIKNISNSGAEQLGFLIHEIGNSLSAASIAHKMIQEGRVGSAGNTSKVLTGCLDHMWHLISSAQMEIRMRGSAIVERTPISLTDVTNDINAIAMAKLKSNEVSLEFDVDPAIQVTADRHLIFSALENLVNNAIKFTKKDGRVTVRGKKSGERVLIEVEDECGGLLEGTTEDFSRPFAQREDNRTGMGLGLSISRRAIELNHGKLTVRNIPKKGCIFTIDLPAGK